MSRAPRTYQINVDEETDTLEFVFGELREGQSTFSETSPSGDHLVVGYWNESDLPIVVAVSYTNVRQKVSLIKDWFEEAVDAALGDRYGDDHLKAHLIP